MRKKLSICIPVLNESGNIFALYERLDRVSKAIQEYWDTEIIFTDNHSKDETWQMVKQLAAKDSRVSGLRFSRNFGFQNSIFAGFSIASGDAICQIDCDLQDPPELIIEFLRLFEEGNEVVYGIRKRRKESVFSSIFRRLGYFAIYKASGNKIPRDAGDFRLVSKRIKELILNSNVHEPYLRGMIATFGFMQKEVVYERDARLQGESKFRFRDIISLGLSGLLNYSIIPLRFASIVGFAFTLLGIFGSLYYLFFKFFGQLPTGFSTITILLLLGFGSVSLVLGVIGEYVGRIFLIVKNEPRFIIEEEV